MLGERNLVLFEIGSSCLGSDAEPDPIILRTGDLSGVGVLSRARMGAVAAIAMAKNAHHEILVWSK